MYSVNIYTMFYCLFNFEDLKMDYQFRITSSWIYVNFDLSAMKA